MKQLLSNLYNDILFMTTLGAGPDRCPYNEVRLYSKYKQLLSHTISAGFATLSLVGLFFASFHVLLYYRGGTYYCTMEEEHVLKRVLLRRDSRSDSNIFMDENSLSMLSC